ncbi:uncharacterized protein F4812DRAFT_451883 [Daldinia caldariorum]|uniref:uncharacterized protein n=1 Tax=Daldinia caldariorum TaxID=326644 RepID=UPI002008C465|nr:uncharacterized protein F4812DRAFT_451883 [Daldinia caldariorum]KAI1466407.1 hypothetical protein F4812DRAFT_451883 [Daldinia caldariorum]
MVDVDIDAFLRQGYWPSSRAKSPDSRFATSNTPSSQSSYVNVTDSSQLPYNTRRQRDYPPPPSVEDETASLAKEYKATVPVPGEGPIHRGDIDQQPILLPVHEFNPERRFVLVPTPSDSISDDSSENVKKLPRRPKSRDINPKPDPDPESDPTSYEANTGRKYESRSRREESPEAKSDPEPKRERRRSKLEQLPTITTDIEPDSRRSDTRRPKSTTRSDKGDESYYSPRHHSRLQSGSMLSPDVIEHASRGRDRAYYKGGSDSYTQSRNRSAHPHVEYEKVPRDDRKYRDKPIKSTKSISPTHHKRRSTADIPHHTRSSSKVDYGKPPPYTERRSPRADDSVRKPYERDTVSQASSDSDERPEVPPHGERIYSSDEDASYRALPRRHRDSFVSSDGKFCLQSPAEIRPSSDRRPRGTSPYPSSRTSQIYERDSPSSSSRSSTFPKDIKFSRSEHRSQNSLSRSSTGRSELKSSAPIVIPAAAAAAAAAATTAAFAYSGSPTDPRRSGILPPPRVGSIQQDPRSSTSALSTSPQRHARHPVESGSPRSIVSTKHSMPPYKRYMDEVQAGELPDMRDCPRRQPTAGHMDWLTLPRCDNFDICPSCYEATFSRTEFAHQFVPVPFRSTDRHIVCDFGTSRYYHIAYFLTRKYGMADLAMFRNIANVTAKSQPCAGAKEVSRIWYSVKDPRLGRPVESFTACFTCAKTIEVLLPNLTGLFVPMDSPAEATRGVCAMHQDNERRFLFYFDLLEAAADKALITKSTPDVQALADRLRDLTAVPECARSTPIQNGKWYTMRSIPDLTVCEECFGEVVWPMIQRDSSSIAANFHKNPQLLPLAACQLYSDRMRNIFQWAVRHNDLRYLEAKVRERLTKEQEYHATIVGLDPRRFGKEWVDAELEQATREWQRWE